MKIICIALMVLFTVSGCNLLKEDFSGGKEIIIQVENQEAVEIETLRTRYQLEELLKESAVDLSTISLKDQDKIEITGLKPEDETTLKEILADNLPGWDCQFSADNTLLTLKPDVVSQIKEQAVLQALEVMKERLIALGLRINYIERESPGSNRLKLRIPPAKQPERVMMVLNMGGILELQHVEGGPFSSKEEALEAFNNNLTEELEILQTDSRRTEKGYYVVKAFPIITHRDIKRAQPSKDSFGSPCIAFKLTPAGGKKFQGYSSANIGHKLAIVLDNRVQSAPVIQAVIYDEAVITGRFTREEAGDLALVLNSGGLPVPVTLLQEKTIEN